jgi:hypothetical protein
LGNEDHVLRGREDLHLNPSSYSQIFLAYYRQSYCTAGDDAVPLERGTVPHSRARSWVVCGIGLVHEICVEPAGVA